MSQSSTHRLSLSARRPRKCCPMCASQFLSFTAQDLYYGSERPTEEDLAAASTSTALAAAAAIPGGPVTGTAGNVAPMAVAMADAMNP